MKKILFLSLGLLGGTCAFGQNTQDLRQAAAPALGGTPLLVTQNPSAGPELNQSAAPMIGTQPILLSQPPATGPEQTQIQPPQIAAEPPKSPAPVSPK